MKHFLTMMTFCLGLAAASAAGQTTATTMKSLTRDGARQAIDAAIAEARRINPNPTGAFAVVDAGGNLILVDRLDGTFAAAPEVSIGKAHTAAMFRKPTRFFEDIIRQGRTPMIALDDFTPLQGGVPIMVDGEVVGAIGVSGAASAQQDDDLAVVGAAAVESAAMHKNSLSATMPVEPLYLDAADTSAAFGKGKPLVENDSFKVHASRREKAGQAEVHHDDTDIIYVLQGQATFVTGGRVPDAASIGPDELRGSAIEGGESRTLKPGDFIVVPAGQPHWFKAVEGAFLYYVVKVPHRELAS